MSNHQKMTSDDEILTVQIHFARQVLQCVAVCCSVLQCIAVCCSVLLCVAVRCSVMQCVAVCCSVLPCVAVCCSLLQCVAECCSALRCVAVCCGVLQYVEVCCKCDAACCRYLKIRCCFPISGKIDQRVMCCGVPRVWIHTTSSVAVQLLRRAAASELTSTAARH